MDIEARKISFIQEFLRLQNEDIISSLENFLHKKKAELADRFNDEIDISLEDAKNGRIIKATALKDKIKKWG
jgi:hypothetical protein